MGTVLVVDDDVSVVRLISLILSLEQISVYGAHSAEEGLDALDRQADDPDLILLDLAMPGMDGREFYRRARLAGYAGPVIFCSSYGAADANRELGGQGAIEKPFDPEMLAATVRNQLAGLRTK